MRLKFQENYPPSYSLKMKKELAKFTTDKSEVRKNQIINNKKSIKLLKPINIDIITLPSNKNQSNKINNQNNISLKILHS
jgi:hypothetical protein